ncbi:MAG: NADH-quinone oxidoreductase subunit K [Anaerolineales bacterium]
MEPGEGWDVTACADIAVAAAEVAVGLALIVVIFRSKKSIDVDQVSSLKG